MSDDRLAALLHAAQEVLDADGAFAIREIGADRRWDQAMAALQAATDAAAGVTLAPELDVERLARAHERVYPGGTRDYYAHFASDLAAEYDRLAKEDQP